MLASLSHMIRETSSALTPAALAQRVSSAQNQQLQSTSKETDIASTTSLNTTDHEGQNVDSAERKAEKERKRRDRRSAVLYETFVVVRPPPSMSNHPLNLQLQLVPPTMTQAQQASTSSRKSQPAEGDPTTPKTRARSPSIRSNRSMTSLYSAASFSTSSIASSTSTGTGARRIIPLYNLSAHNVMTNTVTDAGTDAKVAKFGKRGIEVIGLGILECYEVFSVQVDPSALAAYRASCGSNFSGVVTGSSSATSLREDGQLGFPRTASIVTPSSSNSHLASDNMTPIAAPQTPSTPTANSAKKLFGKMFKRKDGTPSAPSTPTPAPNAPPLSPFFARSSKRTSVISNTSTEHTKVPSQNDTPTPSQAPGTVLQTPTLGTYAALLYRTPSRSTLVPQSVITSMSSNQQPLGLQKSRSKSSFADDMHPTRSREPSQVISPPPPGVAAPHSLSQVNEDTPEILLDGSPPSVQVVPPTFKRVGHSYEWVVRRWIKGADSGLFGIKDSLLSAKSAVFQGLDIPENGPAPTGGSEVIEVRFEWTRGKGSKERARAKKERPVSMMDNSDTGPSKSTFATPESKRSRRKSLEVSPATYNTRSTSPRPSMDLNNSSDESNPGGVERGGTVSSRETKNGESTVYKGARRRPSISVRDREDIGATDEESEAEDSETPWTCTLYVGPAIQSTVLPEGGRAARGSVSEHSRMSTTGSMGMNNLSLTATHHSRAATMDGAYANLNAPSSNPGMRVKLGSMTPAPHHPKVVCQLKMPFPLPDVNIDQGRPVSPSDSPDDKALVLTMEEIKDIVCVTGLWLIVREGFGGLERRRKGDGWKIRG